MLKLWWERIRCCFSENSDFIWLLFGLNYFTLAWSLAAANDDWRLVEYGSALFLVIFLLTIALRVVFRSHPIAFRRVKGGLLLISLLPFLVEFFVMYSYGALIGAGIVNSVLETNLKETKEFFEMYVGWREIAGGLLLLGAVSAVWRLHLWTRLRIPTRWQNGLLSMGLLLAAVLALPTLPEYADHSAGLCGNGNSGREYGCLSSSVG